MLVIGREACLRHRHRMTEREKGTGARNQGHVGYQLKSDTTAGSISHSLTSMTQIQNTVQHDRTQQSVPSSCDGESFGQSFERLLRKRSADHDPATEHRFEPKEKHFPRPAIHASSNQYSFVQVPEIGL